MMNFTQAVCTIRYDVAFLGGDEDGNERCEYCQSDSIRREDDLMFVHSECLELIDRAQRDLIRKVNEIFDINFYKMGRGYKGAIRLINRIISQKKWSIVLFVHANGSEVSKKIFYKIGMIAVKFINDGTCFDRSLLKVFLRDDLTSENES